MFLEQTSMYQYISEPLVRGDVRPVSQGSPRRRRRRCRRSRRRRGSAGRHVSWRRPSPGGERRVQRGGYDGRLTGDDRITARTPHDSVTFVGTVPNLVSTSVSRDPQRRGLWNASWSERSPASRSSTWRCSSRRPPCPRVRADSGSPSGRSVPSRSQWSSASSARAASGRPRSSFHPRRTGRPAIA